MPRSSVPAVASTLCLLASSVVLTGCEGSIGEPSPLFTAAPPPAGGSPDAGGGGLGGPEFDPFEGGSITLGVICDANGGRGRMVLTAEGGGCPRHAELLSGGTGRGDRALFDLPPLEGPGRFEAQGEVCLDGACATRTLSLEVDAIDANGAIGRWTIELPGRTATGSLQATRCAYDAYLPGRDPNLAPNIAITEVALYQAIKIPLMSGGQEAPRESPVVQRRPGLLRIFVEPQVGYTQSRIEAVLTLDPGGGRTPSVRRQTLEIALPSSEENRGQTFEIPLSANDIGPSTRWSVALRGERACAGLGQDTSGARFPTSGELDLGADPVGPLDVTLVPFRYNADGSGRLPVTDEAQLERYREVLFGMFPVEAVNITVREPVDLELRVTPDSGSWGPVLQRLLTVRAEDNPPPNTYYYGIFRPIQGGGWSGTAGLGPVPNAAAVSRRGAIGLGNQGFGAARTCAHELGHAGGRRHAPCGGAGGPDPAFPYSDGSIGVWGYDIVRDTLKNPDTARDFMGYCSNDWISDYNYRALATRYAFVNGVTTKVDGPGAMWRSIYLHPERAPVWDRPVRHPAPPSGDLELEVVFIGASGDALERAGAPALRLDHDDGLIAWIPEPPTGAASVEVDGRRIELAP